MNSFYQITVGRVLEGDYIKSLGSICIESKSARSNTDTKDLAMRAALGFFRHELDDHNAELRVLDIDFVPVIGTEWGNS